MSAIDQSAQTIAVDADEQSAQTITVDTGGHTAGRTVPVRRRRLHPHVPLRAISPVSLRVVWQLTHIFKLVSAHKLPPPSMVVTTAYNLSVHPIPAFGSLQHSMLVSVERFGMGFAFGAAAALLLALVAGLNRAGDAAVDPLVQMMRMLPLFGLIPVFMIWFGIGNLPKILLVALAAFVPLYLNAYSGFRSIDNGFYELATVLKLSRRERLLNVVLPGALPQVLVGVRQSLGTAWLSLVVAEQLNANAGLGFMINQAETFLRNDVIFVALLVYTILGLLTDWVVRALERRALVWRTDMVTR